jgi:hypothetical protein
MSSSWKLEPIAAGAGALPTVMTMDARYWSEDNPNACTDQGIDADIATGLLPLGRGLLRRDADAGTSMAPKPIVEPVNGQIMEACACGVSCWGACRR